MTATVAAKKSSLMKWVILAAALMGAGMMGLLVLAMIGSATGFVGLLVGSILAFLPIPFYILLVLWIDRYEKEPVWMLAMAFIWGATGAVFFSLIFNELNGLIFALVGGQVAAQVGGAVISAPFVEELAKGFAIFLLFFAKKDEFDNITDGIVYAAMVGLGFAMTENVLYYGRMMAEAGLVGSVFLFGLRGLMSGFAHPFFTAFTGVGLGLARETTNRALKVIAPVVGLGLAMFFHFLWNATATFLGLAGALGAYFLIMMPAFVGMIGLILFSLHRERKIIGASLQPYVESGMLTAEDLQVLSTFGGRLKAARQALSAGGIAGWWSEEQFHRTASELAFHRWRTGRGISRGAAADAAREEEYLQRIRELRARPVIEASSPVAGAASPA